MNIGKFSRSKYDKNAYRDDIQESVEPLDYRLSTNKTYNCNRCLSTVGPRSSYMGHGVSTVRDIKYAPSQDLVDLESVLTNRNVKSSSDKKGKVNHADLNSYTMYDVPRCDTTLDPEYTQLSHPSANYRGISINGFYNTVHDPQENLFWNFSTNTSLEAKDNYRQQYPQIWPDNVSPQATQGEDNFNQTCGYKCSK